MSDELVRLMRRKAWDTRETSPATLLEAADRIEALDAEVAKLRAERDGAVDELKQCAIAMKRLRGLTDKALHQLKGQHHD